ncbi:hypothetical protein B0H14DRAFT_2903105 [Mycena olivaceomarginata]|nr:hypothetical protein B0H14DRAFT_2903105 [Mycena olivaceomarginata]
MCTSTPTPAPAAPPHSYYSPPPAASAAFALLTNAHLVSFGKDNTICVPRPSYSFPTSTHSIPTLHAHCGVPRVAAPIRVRAHAHADVHLDALTADAAWDAAHGVERVVPARACAHIADVWWEAEVEREGGGGVPCKDRPPRRSHRSFPVTGTRRRRAMRMRGSTRITTMTTTMTRGR